MIGPRPLVTLAEILAYPHGGYVRLADLAAITGLNRRLLCREIHRGHLRAQQFDVNGCWRITRYDALGYLTRIGFLHAQAS
jgi:hypothetical protein